jgi:phage tail sheath protein FI
MPEFLAPGVYVQEFPASAHPIAAVATSIAVFIDHFAAGPIGQPQQVTSFGDFERLFGGLAESSEAGFAIRQFFDNGGATAWIIGVNPDSGTWDPAGSPQAAAQALIGDATANTGLSALAAVDLFNILCVPATILLPDAQAAQVAAQAIHVCAARRAMYILDAPQRDADRDSVAGIVAWINANQDLRSANASLYFPRPEVADPLSGSNRRIAPSGTLAGLWASTDTSRGVWRAAAGPGARLQGVVALSYAPSETDIAVLNALGVDCLRDQSGLICWGARTLAGVDAMPDDYRYIPVRRTALFIEESVRRGLDWVIFEPNGPALWAQIQADVGGFMHALFAQGAFQGTRPSDAYFVRCDATTNTQTDIDNGIVQVVIGFAALRPAEFTLIGVSQPISGAAP